LTEVLIEFGKDARGVLLADELGVIERENLVHPRALTVLREGQPVGAVLFERVNPGSCFMHVASTNRRWASRGFFRFVSTYLFLSLGVEYAYALIHVDNTPSLRIAERFGFRKVALLPKALSKGDAFLMKISRADAAFLDSPYVFELEVDGDEGTATLVYDTQHNVLLHPGGARLLSDKPFPLDSGKRQRMQPVSNSPSVLKIQFGLACNFSCAYCSQGVHGGKHALPSVEGFLQRVEPVLTDRLRRVEFWGGEPLVYWKQIRELAPALRERCKDVTLSLLTNGSLLTPTKARFLIRHKVHVNLSYDGPGQPLRGPDPLAKPKVREAIRMLTDAGLFSASSVLTAANLRPLATKELLDASLGFEVPFDGAFPLKSYGQDASLSDSELRLMHAFIVKDMLGEQPMQDMDREAARWVEGVRHCVGFEQLPQPCGVDSGEAMTVSLDGKLHLCQNTGDEWLVGTLEEPPREPEPRVKMWHERTHCSTCPVVHLCKGGCLYQDEQDFSNTCRNLRAYYMALLSIALFRSTGYITRRITPLGDLR